MKTIIYTSNTGGTKRYARLLAEQTGLPAYSLTEAKEAVPAGAVRAMGPRRSATVSGRSAVSVCGRPGPRQTMCWS